MDFSEHTETIEEGVRQVAKGLLEHGVTSFCPTVITSPKELYHKVSKNTDIIELYFLFVCLFLLLLLSAGFNLPFQNI